MWCFHYHILKIFSHLLLVTRDTTTYSWDCLWLLLIVIEKYMFIGNCLLCILTSRLTLSVGVRVIRGIGIVSPSLHHVRILTSMICSPTWLTISLVPLLKPADWSLFLSNIIGTPLFSLNSWFDKTNTSCLKIQMKMHQYDCLQNHLLYLGNMSLNTLHFTKYKRHYIIIDSANNFIGKSYNNPIIEYACITQCIC